MAWTPMSPLERASIESQVILKVAVELAVAEIGNEPDGVAVTMAIENARALAKELPNIKNILVNLTEVNLRDGHEIAIAPEGPAYAPNVTASAVPEATAAIQEAFPGAVVVVGGSVGTPSGRTDGLPSRYVDDQEYIQVLAIWNAEQTGGVQFASQQSMFLCNQAIRKLFADGQRNFPNNYWAEALQGEPIPITKNGKCGLGDFKIKKATCVNADGIPYLGAGDGNHPLANKSGYFAALVKLKNGFGWKDRPDPIDPHNWLSQVSA